MGILDGLAWLWRRPLTAAAEPSVPMLPAPTAPEGIEGGGNLGGRLMFEPNAELREQSGYGRAGSFDVGQWRQIALSNPYVSAGLDHVLRPVADARVDVEPAGESSGIDEETAQLHADFVRWCLTERFRLSSLNKQAAAGALLSGFALFEPVAEEVACPLLPGRTVFALKAVPQRLPNSLEPSPWLVDESGRLTGIRQAGPTGPGGAWKRTVLPAERALLFSWKREGGNFAGESQLRSVWYIAGKVMPMLLKMSGVTLQREGAGLPVVVSTDPDAELTPGQRTELVELLSNATFHESMSLVMPKGWDIKWIFSPGANKGHILEAWHRLGVAVLWQFGAQQIALGVSETGSRSVGETHDARSAAMVAEVLGFLADVYNGARGEADGLVKRLIDWNFGPQPAYPKVKLTPKRPELSPAELATAAKLAKEAGLFTPTLEDENSFRERAGFAPIDEREEDEAPSAETEMPEDEESDEGDESSNRPADGAGEEDAKSPPEDKPRASNLRHLTATASACGNPLCGGGWHTVTCPETLKASAQRGPWEPWRPLRASEQRLQLREMDAYLTQRREDFEKRAKPVVVGMLAMAAPAIQSAMADGEVTPAEVAAVPLDEKRLKGLIDAFLKETRAAGYEFVRAELKGAKHQAAAEDEQDDKDTATAVEDADEVTDAEAERLRKRMVNRLRGELEREAIDTMRTGGDASEVVARTVSRQLETGAFKADAGTVTAKVFNVGREEAAQLLGGVASVELTAILDSATCGVCRELDGTTAPFNSPEHDRLLPPVRDCAGGDNCRCLLVFIPEGDE